MVNSVSCYRSLAYSIRTRRLEGRAHSVSREQGCKVDRKCGCCEWCQNHRIPLFCLVRCWSRLFFGLTFFLSIDGLKTRPAKTKIRFSSVAQRFRYNRLGIHIDWNTQSASNNLKDAVGHTGSWMYLNFWSGACWYCWSSSISVQLCLIVMIHFTGPLVVNEDRISFVMTVKPFLGSLYKPQSGTCGSHCAYILSY